MSVVEARRALSDELTTQGYFRDTQRDGDLIFRHADSWRPVVVVSEEGSVKVRRRGFVWKTPGGRYNPDRKGSAYLTCLTPWTLFSCMSVQGLVTDGRKMQGQKTEVVSGMHDEVVGLQDALADEHMTARVTADMSRIWYEGVSPEGEALPSLADRRRALGRLWATRSPTEWGQRAQGLIERFVAIEVQGSPDPFTADEIAHWEAEHGTGRSFVSAADAL